MAVGCFADHTFFHHDIYHNDCCFYRIFSDCIQGLVMTKYDCMKNEAGMISNAHYPHGWVIIDQAGNEMVPCIYDEVILDVENEDPLMWMAAVRVGKYWGFYNGHQMLVKCICEAPFEHYHSYNIARRDEMFALVDDTGVDILPYRFEEYEVLTGDTYAVKSNGLWGIVNSEGEELLPCKCEDMMLETDSFLVPYRLDGKWGIYDTMNARILFSPLWEYPASYHKDI